MVSVRPCDSANNNTKNMVTSASAVLINNVRRRACTRLRIAINKNIFTASFLSLHRDDRLNAGRDPCGVQRRSDADEEDRHKADQQVADPERRIEARSGEQEHQDV